MECSMFFSGHLNYRHLLLVRKNEIKGVINTGILLRSLAFSLLPFLVL